MGRRSGPGDVNPNWETFRRQIPAGLNFSVSGLPYWTTDIGGFVDANPDDPALSRTLSGGFEFGTFARSFALMARAPPTRTNCGPTGPRRKRLLTDVDKFRYRLMPYIYSWHGKYQRGLHHRCARSSWISATDTRAQNIGDQFLFGPAIFVIRSPSRRPPPEPSHLPKADLGRLLDGQNRRGGAPLTHRPPSTVFRLYVRAGSILPTGRDFEYAAGNPPVPSSSASIAEPTAASLSTRTKTTTTITSVARTRQSHSPGMTPPTA